MARSMASRRAAATRTSAARPGAGPDRADREYDHAMSGVRRAAAVVAALLALAVLPLPAAATTVIEAIPLAAEAPEPDPRPEPRLAPAGDPGTVTLASAIVPGAVDRTSLVAQRHVRDPRPPRRRGPPPAWLHADHGREPVRRRHRPRSSSTPSCPASARCGSTA